MGEPDMFSVMQAIAAVKQEVALVDQRLTIHTNDEEILQDRQRRDYAEDRKELEKKIDAVLTGLNSVKETISESKGGYKMMLTIGGMITAVGGVAGFIWTSVLHGKMPLIP